MLDDSDIKEKFIVRCRTCGGNNVTITFYAGFIHSQGGDTGYLTFTCEDCRLMVEIDD